MGWLDSVRDGARSFGRVVDSVVAAISPERAYRRSAYRHVLEEADRKLGRRGFRRAGGTRLTDSPATAGRADYHLESGRDRRELVSEARELERSNAIAEGMLDRAAENVVGCGIKPSAQTDDPGWNEAADAMFAEWAEHGADIRELSDLWELQRLVVRSYLRDGDVATLRTPDGHLQMIESDRLASPHEMVYEQHQVDGIDLDPETGRPIAYHIRRDHGWRAVRSSLSQHDFRELDAERVLFLARRKRLDQTRGTPVFASSTDLFEHLDGLIEAVVVAARMAACFGLVLGTRRPPSGLPLGDGSDEDKPQITLEPGMVKWGRIAEDVHQIKPEHPSTDFPAFTRQLGRLLGIPMGMPLELVYMDFSQTNYSSARAALLQAQRKFKCLQQVLVSQWLRPIYEWKIESWIADGELTDRDDAGAHKWTPPAWPYLDPQKEIGAQIASVDAGLQTLRDAQAAIGVDFDQWITGRAQELELLDEAGIQLSRSSLTRDPLSEPKQWPEGDVVDEDGEDGATDQGGEEVLRDAA